MESRFTIPVSGYSSHFYLKHPIPLEIAPQSQSELEHERDYRCRFQSPTSDYQIIILNADIARSTIAHRSLQTLHHWINWVTLKGIRSVREVLVYVL